MSDGASGSSSQPIYSNANFLAASGSIVSLIEEPIQGVIIDAVMQVTKLDKEDVWQFLDKNKYAFVEWRYYYQDGKNVDISFLYEFATVMNNLVNNVNSKL